MPLGTLLGGLSDFGQHLRMKDRGILTQICSNSKVLYKDPKLVFKQPIRLVV